MTDDNSPRLGGQGHTGNEPELSGARKSGTTATVTGLDRLRRMVESIPIPRLLADAANEYAQRQRTLVFDEASGFGDEHKERIRDLAGRYPVSSKDLMPAARRIWYLSGHQGIDAWAETLERAIEYHLMRPDASISYFADALTRVDRTQLTQLIG